MSAQEGLSGRERAPDCELERQARSFLSPALGFLMIGMTMLVPGVLLVLLGHDWVSTLGVVLVAISLPFDAIGTAGFGSALVARWVARRKSFA
jgi:hypothetical protein